MQSQENDSRSNENGYTTQHSYGSGTLGNGFAVSVQGARHQQDGTPCQDHSRYTVSDDVVFWGVADGHGDKKHSLSHIGSRLALETARPILLEAIQSLPLPDTLSKRDWLTIQNHIERRIRWEWNAACKRSLGLTHSDGSWTPELIQFGTTLIACCQSRHGLLGLQIGDGDMAWMDSNGEVQFMFLEPQDDFGTVTHSLCRPFEAGICQSFYTTLPTSCSMLLLSTDGMGDCLQGERNQFANILPWLAKRKSMPFEELAQWMYKISNNGNGDDMSIAIHYPTQQPSP